LPISPAGGATDRYDGGYRDPLVSNRAAAAMIARSVRRQRPQSVPAPHAAATSLDVDAPQATASDTV
jgi:hypothetical protein